MKITVLMMPTFWVNNLTPSVWKADVINTSMLFLDICQAWCKSGTRTTGLRTLGPLDPGPGTPSEFKGGTPGPPSKFKKETHIMVFPSCFTCYILYEKLINFFSGNNFPRIIFHEFSSCLYGPLNKVIHEKPLKRPNKSGKCCFGTVGICKCTVVFKLKIYNLQMFSRPSNIKFFFVSLNFVLFGIIRTAEVYSEPSRTSTTELFAKIVKGFQLLTIFIKSSTLDIPLSFEYASE